MPSSGHLRLVQVSLSSKVLRNFLVFASKQCPEACSDDRWVKELAAQPAPACQQQNIDIYAIIDHQSEGEYLGK